MDEKTIVNCPRCGQTHTEYYHESESSRAVDRILARERMAGVMDLAIEKIEPEKDAVIVRLTEDGVNVYIECKNDRNLKALEDLAAKIRRELCLTK